MSRIPKYCRPFTQCFFTAPAFAVILRPVLRRPITYMRRKKRLGATSSVTSSTPTNENSWQSGDIIDQVYGNINDVDLSSDTSEQWVPYASPDTEIAASPTEIKGITAPFLQQAFNKGIMRRGPIHVCKVFDAYYFPPWHILASGRKSRPAVTCLYHHGAQNNGVKLSTRHKPNATLRSKNPMDYAVWRRRMKVLVRDSIFAELQTSTRFADGLYVFRLKKFPTELQELHREVHRVVENAVSAATDGARIRADFSKQFEVDEFDAVLRKRSYSPCPRTTPEDWTTILERTTS